MTKILRFAPSPTGYLHIGSARTAIFNYLYARHFGGKFLLRIEDTDKERSTDESLKTILNGLEWLGIDHDDEIIYQSKNIDRHKLIADKLLQNGSAYKCFMTQDEINKQREEAQSNSQSLLINSPWRDVLENEHPKDREYVLRIKAPRDGETIINDLVQGEVKVKNEILDDYIILRSDKTPTYMLSVVVDDHDMGVTDVIRGDDHLNNAFKQKIIYDAMGWDFPNMAHIPLIHGSDGAKLSKRHGALGVEAYRDMGYLPDAIFNYLLSLGWSGSEDKIISKNDSIDLFDGTKIGKSPSRIDLEKLKFMNAQYLREKSNDVLLKITLSELEKQNIVINDDFKDILFRSMDDIKIRSEITSDLANIALIYHPDDIYMIDEKAKNVIYDTESELIDNIYDFIKGLDDSNHEIIMEQFKIFAKEQGLKLGKLMNPIRAIVTGVCASPSVFSIISILGKEKILKRFDNYKNKL